MRVGDEVCRDDHGNKRQKVNGFAASAEHDKEENDDQHLCTDEHVLSVKTEGVAFVDAVTSGKNVRA